MQSNSQLSQFRNRFAKNLEIVQCRPAVFEAPQLNTSLLALTSSSTATSAASSSFGEQFAFVPVAVGFFLGAAFVYGSDLLMSHAGIDSPINLLLKRNENKDDTLDQNDPDSPTSLINGPSGDLRLRRHRKSSCDSAEEGIKSNEIKYFNKQFEEDARWKRILLLIVAITVHNIPEGLAVGVGFGAVGRSEKATFENARNLALGIGIQNFPEGLAVSLPLKAAGFSAGKAIWYGQLSGLVEPFAGLLGAMLVSFMQPMLPYALAFAAGAMVYVVLDDIIPEAQTQ